MTVEWLKMCGRVDLEDFPAMPFVFAALFIKPFLKFAANFRPYLGYVEKLMGLILIFFSILLVTGSISRIANWMLLVFPELFGV